MISILNASLMNRMQGEPDGFQVGIRNAFEQSWDMMPRAGFEQELLRMVQEKSPTIVFMQLQHPGIISPQVAKEIAQLSFVINWSGDIREKTEGWYLQIGREIQLTCFTNQRDVDTLASKGIPSDYLEIGINPEIYRPLGLPREGIVAMFNNYRGQYPLSTYRQHLVGVLKEEFGSLFRVYGNNWGDLSSGDLNGSQIQENEVYNSALIGLNVSHFCVPRYSSDRLLRCAASGALVMSHQYPEMTPWNHLENLVCFQDQSDLINQCRYYLSHPEEATRIAQQGQSLAHSEFTFTSMASSIKELYLKHKK